FADEVFSRDAEMDLAAAEAGDDFPRRHQLHFDARLARDGCAVIALDGLQRQAGIGEVSRDLLLEASLGWDGENEGLRCHQRAPAFRRAASTRSQRMAQPTAGMSALAPNIFKRLS